MIGSPLLWCVVVFAAFAAFGRWNFRRIALAVFVAQFLWLAYSATVVMFGFGGNDRETEVDALTILTHGIFIVLSAAGWDSGRFFRKETAG